MKAKKATGLLLSEPPDSVVRTMSLTPVHSVEEALTKTYQLLGECPSTYVIPYGSIVLPWVEGQRITEGLILTRSSFESVGRKHELIWHGAGGTEHTP